MNETTPLGVVMIGPFPSDPERIEGGVQASLFGLATELRNRPDVSEVRVLATPIRVGGGLLHETIAGIDVTFLDAPWRFLVSSIARLPVVFETVVAMEEPIVHLHGTGIVQAAVLLACLAKKIPVAWTMHGITEKETAEARRREGGVKAWLRWMLYAGCERLQLRLSRHLVVDTPYVAREIAGRTPTPPRVIPQGIFLDELAPAIGADRRAPVVLAIGVIHPRKRHDLLVRAFAEVAARIPEARLVIVGAVADARYLDEVRTLIAELGLRGRVQMRVNESRERVLAAFAEARVFALHSQEESQGIALCEAMASGLPIVATRIGGIPDVLGESRAGFLVDYGDVSAMAAHLERLLTDDTLHRASAAAAVERARAFGWSAIADRIVTVYRAARAAMRPA